jgi:DNA-binding response OmpR family regulator
MGSKRILLVEDDETLGGIVERNLTARGHTVVRVKTAEEALSKLVEDQTDLMLLDIMLPDRSGWDILRRLKTYQISPPVVVMSAVRVSPDRLREFKPLAFLPKPFPLEALLRVVDAAGSALLDEANKFEEVTP